MISISKRLSVVLTFLVLASSVHAQSPREQLQQMVEQLQKAPNDNALRERIIKLGAELKPAPAIPEEAERRMVRGETAFKGATSVADYQEAAKEYEQATLAAPWYGDAYYNLGLVQDKAGDYKAALRSLNFALLTSPDNKEIKALIYQVEYRAEKEDKRARIEQAKHQAVLARTERLRDYYKVLKRLVDGKTFGNSVKCSMCTEAQAKGANWKSFSNRYVAYGAVSIKEDADSRVEISFVTNGDNPQYDGLNYIFYGRLDEGGKILRWTMKERVFLAENKNEWRDEGPSWINANNSVFMYCQKYYGSNCEQIPLGADSPWEGDPSSTYYIVLMKRE